MGKPEVIHILPEGEWVTIGLRSGKVIYGRVFCDIDTQTVNLYCQGVHEASQPMFAFSIESVEWFKVDVPALEGGS